VLSSVAVTGGVFLLEYLVIPIAAKNSAISFIKNRLAIRAVRKVS
jgi:hypothetical protein